MVRGIREGEEQEEMERELLRLGGIDSWSDRWKEPVLPSSKWASWLFAFFFLHISYRANTSHMVQLAQWAGSRTDLFPTSLCILFGKLHSNGKPHSFRYTKRVIERAFGVPFHQIFTEFAETPMGIGAIAQVYKAVLNPDLLPSEYLGPKHVDDPSPASRIGRTLVPSKADSKPPRVPNAAVAIKVLHPGVEKMISRDLKIMMFFGEFFGSSSCDPPLLNYGFFLSQRHQLTPRNGMAVLPWRSRSLRNNDDVTSRPPNRS